jgi:hypothetical protein
MRIFFTLISFLSILSATIAQPLDEKILEGFNFRSVGPAGNEWENYCD